MKTSIIKYILLSVILTISMLLAIFAGISACDFINNEDDPYEDLPPLYAMNLGETRESEEYISVESVEIELESSVVERGALILPSVTIYPANATDQSYTLYTYDETVLRETEGGFIAIGSGYAEIIVLAADGATAWTSLTVVVSVQRVILDELEVTLNVGESKRLTTSIFPADATYEIAQFSSNNESIATISDTGMIHAVAVGSTEITFSVNGVSSSLSVNVVIPITGISIRADRNNFSVGDEGTFTVTFSPEEASNQSYDVSFSNGAELIEGNRFRVTAQGKIEITVTTDGGFSASTTINAIDLDVLTNEVFELTNTERVNAGLPALVWMRQLARAANVRADEIIEYFSHTRPDGRSCFTVLTEFDISYTIAGENLAMGQRTPAEAVTAWMESQGHRENILRAEFNQIGIGAAISEEGIFYWVQMFMN